MRFLIEFCNLSDYLYIYTDFAVIAYESNYSFTENSNICTGKRAFIAGVADDNGYGWAIAKSLAAAGAEILVGTWVPVSYLFFWIKSGCLLVVIQIH